MVRGDGGYHLPALHLGPRWEPVSNMPEPIELPGLGLEVHGAPALCTCGVPLYDGAGLRSAHGRTCVGHDVPGRVGSPAEAVSDMGRLPASGESEGLALVHTPAGEL